MIIRAERQTSVCALCSIHIALQAELQSAQKLNSFIQFSNTKYCHLPDPKDLLVLLTIRDALQQARLNFLMSFHLPFLLFYNLYHNINVYRLIIFIVQSASSSKTSSSKDCSKERHHHRHHHHRPYNTRKVKKTRPTK